MNTTENNKMLAEFLEWEQYPIKGKNNGYKVILKKGYVPFECCGAGLLFHSDWNWIMLVVDKIYKLNTGDWFEVWFSFVKGADIEATYNTCVNFVKWYNENKV